MKERARALLALLVLLSAAAHAQQPEPADVPAGPAAIVGRVLHAVGGAPVAGADVILYSLGPEGVPGLRRARTDESGGFEFAGISNDPGRTFLVGARYQGVPYPGSRVMFAAGELSREVEIPVSEVTPDPAAIRVGEVRLRAERAAGGLRIFESTQLLNTADRTYYRDADGRSPKLAALRAELPEGADAFQMPLGLVPEGVVRDERSVAYYGPVYPGDQEIAWSYLLAAEPGEAGGDDGDAVRLTAQFPSGAERVSVWLPTGGAELADSALSQGENQEEEGRSYRVFEGDSVAAGGALSLVFSLPAARVDPDAVTATETRLVLSLDDAAVDVNETHVLHVRGDHRVISAPGKPLYRVALPEGISQLRFGTNQAGLRITPDPEGGLAVEGEATPGEARVELAYRMAVDALPFQLERSFDARLPVLSIFLADTGRLVPVSDRLHRRRPVRTQDLTYLHLEAFEIDPGETVALSIGLRDADANLPRPAFLLAIGLLAVLSAGFLAAPLRASLGAHEDEDEAPEPPAARERASLYEAIQDLDFDFETGKVSEADHAELRTDLRQRALALLQAERDEAAAPSSSAKPEEPRCPGCQIQIDPDDRFCSQCGARLDGAEA